MKVGDLVRYRQGSLDMTGLILEHCDDGDYLVFFAGETETQQGKISPSLPGGYQCKSVT